MGKQCPSREAGDGPDLPAVHRQSQTGLRVALSLPVGASDLERSLGPTAAQMGVLHLFLCGDDFRGFISVLLKLLSAETVKRDQRLRGH